jgi:hypothetical protein
MFENYPLSLALDLPHRIASRHIKHGSFIRAPLPPPNLSITPATIIYTDSFAATTPSPLPSALPRGRKTTDKIRQTLDYGVGKQEGKCRRRRKAPPNFPSSMGIDNQSEKTKQSESEPNHSNPSNPERDCPSSSVIVKYAPSPSNAPNPTPFAVSLPRPLIPIQFQDASIRLFPQASTVASSSCALCCHSLFNSL